MTALLHADDRTPPARSDGQSWVEAEATSFKPRLALELILKQGGLTRYLKSDPHATPASMYYIPENQPILDAVTNLVGAHALDANKLLQAPEGQTNAKGALRHLVDAVVTAHSGLYEAGKVNEDPFTAARACDSFADYVQAYVEQGLRAHPTVTVSHY